MALKLKEKVGIIDCDVEMESIKAEIELTEDSRKCGFSIQRDRKQNNLDPVFRETNIQGKSEFCIQRAEKFREIVESEFSTTQGMVDSVFAETNE